MPSNSNRRSRSNMPSNSNRRLRSRTYTFRSECLEQAVCSSGSPKPEAGSTDNDNRPRSGTTSPTQVDAVCSMRNKSSTWKSSLYSALKKISNTLEKLKPSTSNTDPIATAEYTPISLPKTSAELDAFIAEVWQNNVSEPPRNTTSPVSQYIQKVTELKVLFDQKMAEISQREATYISELTYFDETTPLIPASEISCLDEALIRKILKETNLGCKFDNLRLQVKKGLAQTILELRSHYFASAGSKKLRKLRPKTIQLLKQWFDCHIDNPYPTEADKQLLAIQGGATVEQVMTWLVNKRTRGKKMREVQDRRSRSNAK